jgi:RimJ/RimL family protein N-acetyltransferase
MQGKGIGTRMIKSIKENPDFFTYSKHKGEIYASVEHSNEVSIRAFLKNGFTAYRPAHPTTSGIVDGRFDPLANYNKYTRLYFSERAVVDEVEDELVD